MTAPAVSVALAEDVIVIVAVSFPATAVNVGVAGNSACHFAKRTTVEVSEYKVTVWVSL